MARVAVVLPVYNHGRYIDQTLHSLFDQDFRDFEIVAVDDGSTDNSLEILNRYHSRIRIIESSHQGPSVARNLAIHQGDSEYVAFMDADDLSAPQRLGLELDKLESEGLDLVSSALSFIDAGGAALPGQWQCPAYAPNDYWGALIERNWIGTPSVLLRRRVLDQAGRFDERFTHSEDYDLWLRVGASCAIGYIDRPLIQCRRHSANTSGDIELHHAFERLALQKVNPSEARRALARLHPDPMRGDEAWIWFLLRSGDTEFRDESRVAAARHPHSHAIRFAIGVFQHDCGEWRQALATFRDFPGDDAASRHNAGVLAALCGDRREAERHLECALQARPDYYDARFNLLALAHGAKLRLTRRPFRESLVPMMQS